MQVLMDYINELNWIAVLVASLAAFASGAIWYSEAVFGKAWMKAVGLTRKDTEKANMPQTMGLSFVATIISAVSIGVLVQVLDLTTALQGASFGIMVAVGILSTNKLMMAQFEMRSIGYSVLTLGGDVVALGIMGAILAVWR
jgi:hypothetical protein